MNTFRAHFLLKKTMPLFSRPSAIVFLLILLLPLLVHAASFPTTLSGTDLIDAKKKQVSLQGKKGLVVVFLSAKCPCSNSHIPELNSLVKTYPEFSFVAIHSNVDETASMTLAYFKNRGLLFPVFQDEHNKLADAFRAFKTPHAFIVLPSGELAYRGGVSSSANFAQADTQFLRNALEDLKQNRPVQKKEGRTLGCVIKRG